MTISKFQKIFTQNILPCIYGRKGARIKYKSLFTEVHRNFQEEPCVGRLPTFINNSRKYCQR